MVRSITAIALALAAAAMAQDSEACLECHADPDLVREGDWRPGTSVYVAAATLEASAHPGFECVDCHAGATEDHDPRLPALACAECHDDAQAQFAGSLHGRALARGEADAPDCAACHGGHDIRAAADPASRVSRANLPLTCATCHADPGFIQRQPLAHLSPLQGYEQSVHFAALQGADGDGATCTDCHQAHGLRAPDDPASSIHRTQIPATCGRCHGDIRTAYEASIHGQALRQGSTGAPTCVDCHGEHEVRRPDDPLSRVYPTAIVNSTCVQCHENERITSRYGLPRGRLDSYRDTYHGLAIQDGTLLTAHCASCHGVHNILPSSDPASTISPINLQATCGECHPEAGQRFTQIPVHAAAGTRSEATRLTAAVRGLYLWLIGLVIGAMVAHNGLVVVQAVRQKYRATRSGATHTRFTPFQVSQHLILGLSFAVLAVTGFALKFPDALWVQPLVWLGLDESARRLVHRGAGVVLLAQSALYLVYLASTRRGRWEVGSLRPRWRDVTDLGAELRYFLGRAPRGAAFGRYGYVEKLEFWALVWGNAVMGFSGLVLWLPERATRWFPGWVVELSEVVHYYEAWLALLAILVWHLFHVIFHPREFPLNLACVDGKLSVDEQARHHPLEGSDPASGA